ncbi:hypothetical protein [Streptomyces sp. NPDC053427]|uniref:hypothetical protein n=1 Tax=Streptomyces sp. NPDC053427 TaxID=3365701 RepID=UPI0037D7035D
MQRAPKIRLLSLAGTAVLAVVVPLAAATAGPADTATWVDDALTGSGARLAAAAGSAPENTHGSKRENRPGSRPDGARDNKAEKPADKAENGRSGRAFRGPLAGLGLPLLSGGDRTVRCGPELGSPRGIEAQTCVLAEKGLTWARTYYRNATGDPLRAVLTLLRPDGRSVQVHCEVPAAGVPGVCETPIGATRHRGRLRYDAVAEVSDAAGERLLLRSGANSAPEGEASGPRRKS